MRMLLKSELEAVCGGQDSGHTFSHEIVIPGYPPGGGSYWPGGGGGAGGAGSGGGGCDTWDCTGDGVGSSPPPSFYDHSRCEQEVTVDAVAGVIERAIKAQPDWNEREYSAFIYVDRSGNITTSNLFRGETVQEALTAGRSAPETRLTIPSDALQIIGIIHNHPDIGYDAMGDLRNRNPSNNDWGIVQSLDGRGLYNPGLLNQYIIDSTGHVRQFTISDMFEFDGDSPGAPPMPGPQHEIGANQGC